MDNKGATRTCGQCHKQVAEANFSLHETHCSRFLCVCPHCDEAVPTGLLQQHREEQHTQVRCSKCNQKMERCHLTDHESDECVERLLTCQFCELELPSKNLGEHSVVCGSRTELCLDCGRYVTLRDRPHHTSACSATHNGSAPSPTTSRQPARNTKITVSCNGCMTSFPAEDIEEHELECVPATRREDEEEAESEEEEREEGGDVYRQGATAPLSSPYEATSLSGTPSAGPRVNGGDPDQIRTCPYCHLALPLSTLQWHKVKCQIHIGLK